MYPSTSLLSCSTLLLTPLLVSSQSFQPCPFLGPFFPKPVSLPTQKPIKAALQALTSNLTQSIADSNSTGGHGPIFPNTTTFSVALFDADASASSPPFFYDFHHTAPLYRSSHGESAVKNVNADAVYKIGDLTEVFAVWAWLIEVGDAEWDRPITRFVPELADATAGDEVEVVRWCDVTVGDLAGHLSGMPRDYGVADLASENADFQSLGLPLLNEADEPTCGFDRACTRAEFFEGITKRKPVFLPGTTPIYSEASYQILRYAVENITGRPFDELLSGRILKPLNMTQTSLAAPGTGVIPVNETSSAWNAGLGDFSAAKGMYSTLTDLSKAGKNILASTLLPSVHTRRWLKPVSHTSNSANSVSRPWDQIYSAAAGDSPGAPIIDVYSKRGEVGLYSAYLSLVPDFNIGYAVLAADTTGAPDLNAYVDVIGDVMQEALFKTAALQAQEAFAGSYGPVQSGLNSSMNIKVDAEPGMTVTSLVNNGVDVVDAIARRKGITGSAVSFRLYPTNLRSGSRMAFRAVFQNKDQFEDSGTPTCESWLNVDQIVYGSEALDEFIFDLEEDGRAKGVEIPALRVTLGKKS